MSDDIHDPACPCSGICDPRDPNCYGGACGCECVGIVLGRAGERERMAKMLDEFAADYRPGQLTHSPWLILKMAANAVRERT